MTDLIQDPVRHPVQLRKQASSALSQALQAIREDLKQAAPSDSAPIRSPDSDSDSRHVRVRVANDFESRVRAYRLAYTLYRQKGYVEEDEYGMVVEPYDAQPETLTLLAEDEDGRAVATVSLVFDRLAEECALPSAALYPGELGSLRAAGRRMAEVTRLAIAPGCGSEKGLLVRLFKLIYFYARRAMGCTDFVIEVNPRHLAFYRRALCFEPAGPRRPCHRVGDAPAVLLRLDFEPAERMAARGPGDPEAARTIFPAFLNSSSEAESARRFAEEHRPLAVAEAQRLGLAWAFAGTLG